MRWYYLFFCLVPLWANAQNILISDEVNLSNYSAFEIIGEINNNTLLFLNSGRNYKIIAFNDQMRKSWDREIEFAKRTEVIKTHMMPGDSTFSIFYTQRTKGVNYLLVDTYTGGVALQQRDTILQKRTNYYSFDFLIEFSSDNSKVLLVQLLQGIQYHPIVFDMKSKEVVLDGGEIDFDVEWAFNEYFLVTNKGEFLYAAVDNYTRNSKGCQLFLQSSEQILKFKVEFNAFININELISFDNLHRNIVIAGLYTDNRQFKAVGSYFTAIDVRSGRLLVSQKEPFDRNFMIKYENKRKKPRKGLDNMKLKEIIHLRDGGIVLLGEEEKVISRGMTSGNTLGIEYNLDEVFAMTFNGKGALVWQDVFPKRQYSYADNANFSSFFVMESSNFLRLILNDNIKPETTVSEFLISGNGSFWRKSIMSTQDLNISVRFKDGLQLSPKRVIFPSESRGRLKLLKFIY